MPSPPWYIGCSDGFNNVQMPQSFVQNAERGSLSLPQGCKASCKLATQSGTMSESCNCYERQQERLTAIHNRRVPVESCRSVMAAARLLEWTPRSKKGREQRKVSCRACKANMHIWGCSQQALLLLANPPLFSAPALGGAKQHQASKTAQNVS